MLPRDGSTHARCAFACSLHRHCRRINRSSSINEKQPRSIYRIGAVLFLLFFQGSTTVLSGFHPESCSCHYLFFQSCFVFQTLDVTTKRSCRVPPGKSSCHFYSTRSGFFEVSGKAFRVEP